MRAPQPIGGVRLDGFAQHTTIGQSRQTLRLFTMHAGRRADPVFGLVSRSHSVTLKVANAGPAAIEAIGHTIRCEPHESGRRRERR